MSTTGVMPDAAVSAALERLLPAALVGTERAPGWRAALSAAPAPLNGLMAALAATPDEDAAVLLRAAGVLALAARTGADGLALPAEADALPARPERRPALADPSSRAVVETLLQDDWPTGLRHAMLRRLAERGWRLPAALLPQALELAQREPALRAAVGAVIGERGAWLIRQQPRWRQLGEAPAQPTEADWTDGTLTARLAFLRHARAQDPAAARARLEAELGQLAAAERAQLVEALAVGLSMADEPLLMRLLQRDRGGEVRAVAARLLQRLPDSAQAGWLAAQWDALLKSESAWLGLKRRWTIEPPAAEGADWKAHGLDLQRPRHDGLGERGWWLFQLVRLTPLSFWTTRTGLTPADLMTWAKGTDWKDALRRGWFEAAQALPDDPAALAPVEVEWLLALLGRDARGASVSEQAALRRRLPPAQRTALWRARLAGDPVEVAGEIVLVCEQAALAGVPDPAGSVLDAAFLAELGAVLEAQWSALCAGQLDDRRCNDWLGRAPALLAWLPAGVPGRVEALPEPMNPTDAAVSWAQQQRTTLHARLQRIAALRRALEALPAAPAG